VYNYSRAVNQGVRTEKSNVKYRRRSFIQKFKHRKYPNNIIIKGRFGIAVPKATTAVSNYLTTCAVVDGS
jgi:hypothetical protein